MVKSGPDYAGYYKQRLLDLIMQNKSLLLPQNSQSRTRSSRSVEYGDVDRDDQNMQIKVDSGSGILFSHELGKRLMDFDRDMLKAILHECVVVLNQEVEQVIENFVRLCNHSDLDKKPTSLIDLAAADKDQKSTFKKQRTELHPINMSTETHSSRSSGQDHQRSHGSSSSQPEATIDNDTLKLSAKLKYMEGQLDEFVDILMSICRPMTHAEKVQLRWFIQELPSEALGRVVDILGKRNPSVAKCSEEINIELENEDHVTLWRLYYYVRAVSNASR